MSVSSLIATLSARAGHRSIGEVLIPRSQELRLVGADQFENTCQFVPPEAATLLKTDRTEPNLGAHFLSFHVNMRRFQPVAREEEEPVGSNAENGWHELGAGMWNIR